MSKHRQSVRGKKPSGMLTPSFFARSTIFLCKQATGPPNKGSAPFKNLACLSHQGLKTIAGPGHHDPPLLSEMHALNRQSFLSQMTARPCPNSVGCGVRLEAEVIDSQDRGGGRLKPDPMLRRGVDQRTLGVVRRSREK